MLTGRKAKKGEIDRGLVVLWLTRDGDLSLDDMMQRLRLYGRRPGAIQGLGQTIRPLIKQKIIMRVSEYPNPRYSITRES